MILIGSVIYKIQYRYHQYQQLFPGDYVGQIVLLFSYMLNGILVGIERRLYIHTSVVLFYFWLLHLILRLNLSIFHNTYMDIVNGANQMLHEFVIFMPFICTFCYSMAPKNYLGLFLTVS